MSSWRNWLWVLMLAGGGMLAAAPANAITIDFEFFDTGGGPTAVTHGQIIDNEYSTSHGVNFRIDNVNIPGTNNPGVAFESDVFHSEDPDLRGPNSGGGGPNWDSGNLRGVHLGNILIIQEVPGSGNNSSCNGSDCSNPDDEGRRPAGSIFISFDTPIVSFGFDLVDVEGPSEFGNDAGFFASFFDEDGTQIGDDVGFGDLAAADGSIDFGNNSANRISPIIIANLSGLGSDNRAKFVEINFGGSAGIDNIRFTEVPEPGTLALFGIGLAGLGVLNRRRRKNASAV